MRISDWSSDVCSSDLTDRSEHQPGAGALHLHVAERLPVDPADGDLGRERRGELRDPEDRKSVVLGKSVSVSVDLGGRRLIKTKKDTVHITHTLLTEIQQFIQCYQTYSYRIMKK